ncbi:MAG: hypothetical protein OEW90_01755 [Betaproteobacteria bacterium]|nr:hypothetical protein [Betaproteobacteria bacterium]MDH4322844.1 hypothetical protein [Betaproteobacteria bacterium]
MTSAQLQAEAQFEANAIQRQLVDMSQEEWDLYKTEAVPLLKSLVDKRSPITVEQEQAQVAGETKAAFGQARQQLERAIGRQRNPGDQGYAALMAPTYIDEAGAVSKAITDARRTVDDRDWARTLQTVQAFQRLPQDASASAASAGAIAGRSAQTAGAMSLGQQQLAQQQASQSAYGSVAIANAARRWFNQPGGQPGGSTFDGGAAGSVYDVGFNQPGVSQDYSQLQLKHGGRIDGPGTGTSDSVPAVVDGRKRVQLSSGEYVIPADVVRKKGQEFFDKMLQKYHRPAPERERAGMANGGVLQRRGLPADVEDAIFVSLPREALSTRRGR